VWGTLSDERTGLSFVHAALASQSFSVPSLLELATIFYCLRFETSLFVAWYDSQGHDRGIWPRLYTGAGSLTLRNEDFQNLYSSPNITRLIKSLGSFLKLPIIPFFLGSNILRKRNQFYSIRSSLRLRTTEFIHSLTFTDLFLQFCNWRYARYGSNSGFCVTSSCVHTIRVLLTFKVLSTLMSPSEWSRSHKLQVFPAADGRPRTSSFSSSS
jgi:hypothetical protein